jgi:2OG-Fe(II) oxygenase superfamily
MTLRGDVALDLGRWADDLPEMTATYRSTAPYPHIVIDDFLSPEAAVRAARAFPPVEDTGWIHYVHFNECKHGLNSFELIPPDLQAVIEQLNSPATLRFLEELTGIPDLLSDDMLEGGGLHQTERGGFLKVHADFTVHPHHRHLRRRVNLLLYLNEHWQDDYGGELELWDRSMSHCQERVSPLFNRVVIFNTDADSFHGVPTALRCPEGMTRKSVALYYFTEELTSPRLRATNYRARPGQDNRVLIWLDRTAVAGYTRLKGRLGLTDGLASRALNRLRRR